MDALGRLPRGRGEVLSVVERGWRGARECSLILNRMAIPVTHLIKGCLGTEFREIIRPYPYIRLVSVPRWLFRVWLWEALVWRSVMGRLRWLFVDHQRTLREVAWWCRMFGVTPVSIRETEEGYELWIGTRRISPQEIYDDAERRG